MGTVTRSQSGAAPGGVSLACWRQGVSGAGGTPGGHCGGGPQALPVGAGSRTREGSGGRTKALKAQVRAGRLVLDEPTNLPEGAEVRVALVDDDELDDKERAELHAALLAAEAELDAGQAVSEADLWARLRTAK